MACFAYEEYKQLFYREKGVSNLSETGFIAGILFSGI